MEQRTVALAAALAERALTDSGDLADALAALATAQPSPWSVFDAAIASLNDDYQQLLGPALVSHAAGVAQAQRTYEVAVATAARTAEVAIFSAKYARDGALAAADVDRIVAENAASLAAANIFSAAEFAAAQHALAGDRIAPTDPAQPISSPPTVTGPANTQPDGGLFTPHETYQRPAQPLAAPAVPLRIDLLKVYGLRLGDLGRHGRTLLDRPQEESQQAYSSAHEDGIRLFLGGREALRPSNDFTSRAHPLPYDALLKSGVQSPFTVGETPAVDEDPKSFQDVIDKLSAQWDKPREELIAEFGRGVLEGFWDGLKGSVELIGSALSVAARVNNYAFYSYTPTCFLARKGGHYLFDYDPIAAEAAFVARIQNMFAEFTANALVNGADDLQHSAVNAALHAATIAAKTKAILAQVDKFLQSESNRQQLAEAVLNGDWEKLEELKHNLPSELQGVLDAVYAAGVSFADALAGHVTPHKLGYLVGQLLYETAENYAVALAWSAATGATAGAAGVSLPAVVAARAAKLSRTLHITAKKLGIDESVLKFAINAAQDGIWWALRHVEMCFVAGTPVHTEHGLVPIEQVRAGEFVWARPDRDATAKPRLCRVQRTLVTRPSQLFHITCETAAGATETLSGTGEHPFFVVGNQAFTPAKELAPGDELRLLDGSSAWVTQVATESAAGEAAFTTYNLVVERAHTYHVGRSGVWVHNTGSEICQQLGKKLQQHLKRHPNLPDAEVRQYLERELREQLGDIADSEMSKHIDDVLKAAPSSNQSLREQYLGRTPGKGSRTGREVISQMERSGDFRWNSDRTAEVRFVDPITKQESWHPLNATDMGHLYDAVRYWNETGRFLGPKHPEVRKWMLDPANYKLLPYGFNRSGGAQLKERYMPPPVLEE